MLESNRSHVGLNYLPAENQAFLMWRDVCIHSKASDHDYVITHLNIHTSTLVSRAFDDTSQAFLEIEACFVQ